MAKQKRLSPFGWFVRAFAAGFGAFCGLMCAVGITLIFSGFMINGIEFTVPPHLTSLGNVAYSSGDGCYPNTVPPPITYSTPYGAPSSEPLDDECVLEANQQFDGYTPTNPTETGKSAPFNPYGTPNAQPEATNIEASPVAFESDTTDGESGKDESSEDAGEVIGETSTK